MDNSANLKSYRSENNIKQFCSFELAGRLFGVDILDVKEINKDIEITPVFHAAHTVSGYMNIRGQIHLVLDLRKIFGFESKLIDQESKVIIFKPSVDEPFGILVDKISDVVTVAETQIQERRQGNESLANEKQSYERRFSDKSITSGVCKLENDLMVVLNARSLLSVVDCPEMFAGQSV